MRLPGDGSGLSEAVSRGIRRMPAPGEATGLPG